MNLASGLAARGHEVDVVSVFQDRTEPRHTFDPSVPVVPLIDLRIDLRVAPANRRTAVERPGNPPSAIVPEGHPVFAPYDRTTDRILGEYLAASPADVLISAWPVLHHFLAALAPRSAVTVAHDHLLYEYHQPAIRPALHKAYAKLDCIVSVAEAAASGYREKLPELAHKIHCIPNAVRSLGAPAATGESRLVVTAGRLDRMKRFDLLIKAFARVVRTYPDWRLRIYGEGRERENLAQLIRDLQLYEHVFLMGMVSPMEAEWVKGSIGVLTSEAESFGLVIPEAMQAGLPMISTNCPVGPREIIDHGVDGLLVPPGDEEAIASAIARLIESPARRQAMAANAVKKAERFSSTRIAGLHEELYRELVCGRASKDCRRNGGRPPVREDLAVTCTSISSTELELVVEGVEGKRGAEQALLTRSRDAETLPLSPSALHGDAACFRIALDDLRAGGSGTWSLTVGGKVPRVRLVDNRRLVACFDARSGQAGALLPVNSHGTLKIQAITEPSRAQLAGLAWAGAILSLEGALLGDGWPDLQVQIDTATGSERLAIPCEGGTEGFCCKVDTAAVYARLGAGDGRWRVWLADAVEPSRRARIGRVVSDLRDPGAVAELPSGVLIEANGGAVRLHPRYSRTGLLTLEVEPSYPIPFR